MDSKNKNSLAEITERLLEYVQETFQGKEFSLLACHIAKKFGCGTTTVFMAMRSLVASGAITRRATPSFNPKKIRWQYKLNNQQEVKL